MVLHKLEALIGASGERGISFETIKESNDLGISDRTLQRRLATLVEQGNIEPIGHTRALRYRKLVGLAHTANSPERSVAPSPEPAATDTPLVMFASSELTGGAGFTFEDAVAATYYAALIAQTKSVPGMPDRIVCRVAQQQASNGEPLDDLIVDGAASDSSLARLSLQVKRALTVSDAASNTDFQDIILKSWKTIKHVDFRCGVDRVGGAVGSIADAIRRAIESLCEAARNTDDQIAFMAQFRTRGGASSAQRQVVKALRGIFSRAGVENIDNVIFELLQHFVLVQFNVLHEGALDPALAIAQLSSSLAPEDVGRAPDLWHRLCSIARTGAGRKAAFARPALLSMLHGAFRFAGSPSLKRDLEALAVETQLALDEIVTEIDGIRVPRSKLGAEIEDHVGKYRMTQIIGLAGTGKSVLMEQMARTLKGPLLFIKSDRLSSSTWSHYAAGLGVSSRDPVELLAEIAACGTGI